MQTLEDHYPQLVQQIDCSRLPKHIAVIMDGNGRWARIRELPRIEGHRAGVKAVREVVTACRELGVNVLTLYAFSVENWKRPRAEISALMNLLIEFLEHEETQMREKGIRFNAVGRISGLPRSVQKAIERAKQATEKGAMMLLNLALNYGARTEIEDAVGQIVQKALNKEIKRKDISVATIQQHLYTAGMPDPELLIRTSGELRVSNFLLWQIAYTELYFTEVLWPDFRKEHLREAFDDFRRRKRRFGDIESN